MAAWALMFSVMTSGAAAASSDTFVLKNNGAASVGLFACFKRHMTQHAATTDEKAPEKRSAGNRHCPECCLVALGGAAVLPERIAKVARPVPTPAPAFDLATTYDEPKSAHSGAVNGARAPPV